MTTTCEQFCSRPIGPDGNSPTDITIGECGDCVRIRRWLSRDVLPAIRRYGYYAPSHSDPSDELAAMLDQQGLRGELRELLEGLREEFPDVAGLLRLFDTEEDS